MSVGREAGALDRVGRGGRARASPPSRRARRCGVHGCRCARRSKRRSCRRVASRSAFDRRPSGTAVPQPMHRDRQARLTRLREPRDRLAGAEALAGVRQHAHQRAAERAAAPGSWCRGLRRRRSRRRPAARRRRRGACGRKMPTTGRDDHALGHGQRLAGQRGAARRDRGEWVCVPGGTVTMRVPPRVRRDRMGLEQERTGTSGTVRLASAGDHRAVADLDERVGAERGERLHRRAPAHGHRHVLRASARAASSSSSVVRGAVVVGDDRCRGACELHVASARRRSRAAADAMSGVWNAPPTFSVGRSAHAELLRPCDRGFETFGRSGDHDLSGRVVVRDPAGVGRGGARFDRLARPSRRAARPCGRDARRRRAA